MARGDPLLPVPWIPYTATAFLDTIVQKDWSVFEWGSGGSTWYWSLNCGAVVSIEDDLQWYGKVVELLEREEIANVDLRHIPGEPGALSAYPDKHHPLNYCHVRWDHVHHPWNYTKYAKVIEEWEPDTFDLIFVDAMARPSCFHHGISRIKPGGWLLWDNSGYKPNIRFVEHLLMNWQLRDFHGPGPYIADHWNACIWRRPL